MKKIALYDIDYTVISSNSLKDFFLYCLLKNPLKIIYLPFLGISLILWALRIISFEKIKSYFLIMVKGKNKKSLDAFSSDFVSSMIIPKIKAEALKSIKDNRKEGRIIILSTASYEFYIKHLADYLKADYYYGTKALFKNNKVMIALDGANCKGKEKIRRILEDFKLTEIDKKHSIGYTDSTTDLPYLKIVDELIFVHRKKWLIKKNISN